MTIEEMKARKAELGYTNETVAALSGVPLGTVQKIFAGETKAPRYDTVQKLIKILGRQPEAYAYEEADTGHVMETVGSYVYQMNAGEHGRPGSENRYLKPPKKKLGIADGKYRMPPDELFFDDEIAELFEDL